MADMMLKQKHIRRMMVF